MADEVPKYARTGITYLAMIIAGLIGYGVSYGLLRLGARITQILNKFNLIKSADATKDANNAKLAGTGIACIIYLAGLAWGWHKSGLMGDCVVGFTAGALIDEMTAGLGV